MYPSEVSAFQIYLSKLLSDEIYPSKAPISFKYTFRVKFLSLLSNIAVNSTKDSFGLSNMPPKKF